MTAFTCNAKSYYGVLIPFSAHYLLGVQTYSRRAVTGARSLPSDPLMGGRRSTKRCPSRVEGREEGTATE